MTKGIIFYTDNRLDPIIAKRVQDNLKKISKKRDIPIVCSSLKKMDFGDKNICLAGLERGPVTMFKQIFAALEASTSDIIFFCGHDVLYLEDHFEFTPPEKERYYYNEYVWKMEIGDGIAMRHYCLQTSGLCSYRETVLEHYKKRLKKIQDNINKEGGGDPSKVKYGGHQRSDRYEPGVRIIIHGEGTSWKHAHHIKVRIDDVKASVWKSETPLVDIKHSNCVTADMWQLKTYKKRKYLPGHKLSNIIPGWGEVKDIIK